MGANWGKNIRLSIFGESHGPAIGMVVDGLPRAWFWTRRPSPGRWSAGAPGRNKMSTQRREGDKVRILSGFYQGKTTGGPLCGVIENTNQRSGDYGALEQLPRPDTPTTPGPSASRAATTRGGEGTSPAG